MTENNERPVLIIVSRRYNGHELWTTLGTLQQRGHRFEVVSSATVIRDEITYQPNRIKRTVNEVPLTEIPQFKGLMVISGNMSDTEAMWYHDHTQALIVEAHNKKLPLAAICCSVPSLRKVARGKRVSFYPLVRSRNLLEQHGAILETVTLTRDDPLVTAEHQMATQMWAEEYCNLLEGKPKQHTLIDSGYTPRGNERMPIPELERLKEAQCRAKGIPYIPPVIRRQLVTNPNPNPNPGGPNASGTNFVPERRRQDSRASH